jgi:hypothetical protein
MKKISILCTIVLFTTLFLQCKNHFLEADKLPEQSALQDKEIKVAKNDYVLLDLTENFITGEKSVFKVKNIALTKGQFKITRDGYLVYKAPDQVLTDELEIEIKSIESGEVRDVSVFFEVSSTPIGSSNCYQTLELVSIFNTPVTLNMNDWIAKDTLCGNKSSGEFEPIFEPYEMPYKIENGQLTLTPNPGGLDIDFLVLKGIYANNDSAYIKVLVLLNRTGCSVYGVHDNFNIQYSSNSLTYSLNVLDNDLFCPFATKDMAQILEINGTPKFGTVQISPNQKTLEYKVNPSFTLPIKEEFSIKVRYNKTNGFADAYTNVNLSIQ